MSASREKKPVTGAALRAFDFLGSGFAKPPCFLVFLNCLGLYERQRWSTWPLTWTGLQGSGCLAGRFDAISLPQGRRLLWDQ